MSLEEVIRAFLRGVFLAISVFGVDNREENEGGGKK